MKVEILSIEVSKCYPLRHKMLRKGKPLETCHFDGDNSKGTFHLGAIVDKEIIGIISIYEKDLSQFKNSKGEKIVDLYFKPLTRYDRQKAQSATGTDEALVISTQLLCQMAEKEDGSKFFAMADAPDLQRLLPEKVLNDVELFLFEVKLDLDTAKKV